MHGYKPGEEQVYMAAYRDKDDDWLDESTNYVLNIPLNVPAEELWSLFPLVFSETGIPG